MLEWIYNNEALSWWLLSISLFSFIATLIAVPIVLIRLPENYFSFSNRHRITWRNSNTWLQLFLFLIKNLLGAVFIFLGILMLVLPGQGLLTILIGLILLEFPGKYRLERWLVNQPIILRNINWVRSKAGKGHLIVDRDGNTD